MKLEYEVVWHWDYEEYFVPGVHLKTCEVAASDVLGAVRAAKKLLHGEYSFTNPELIVISATPKGL